MRGTTVILAGIMLAGASAAQASDKDPCGTGMVCATKPATVVTALQDAGYKAKLTTDDEGEPLINTAAGGYSYDIYFEGCELKEACDSLQFIVSFTKDPTNTPALANEWNYENRFSQASIAKNGNFILTYDVTTRGGLTAKNMADVLDRWANELGGLHPFFDKHPVPPAAK